MTAVRKKVSSRGSKPGERRGGRQKGTPNKSTADVKALIDANVDMVQVVRGLAQIAIAGDTDAAKVAASKELLDRRFGKATQPLSGDKDAPPLGILIATGVPRAAEGH